MFYWTKGSYKMKIKLPPNCRPYFSNSDSSCFMTTVRQNFFFSTNFLEICLCTGYRLTYYYLCDSLKSPVFIFIIILRSGGRYFQSAFRSLLLINRRNGDDLPCNWALIISGDIPRLEMISVKKKLGMCINIDIKKKIDIDFLI